LLGNKIGDFPSLTRAAKAVGVSHSAAFYSVSGAVMCPKKFIFKYAEQ